jgi:glycosyltransferase involved in cell wall biosynthesis
VVMSGPYETFGLVALEAAASGASVVACETAPSARVIGPLAERFAPGDVAGLLAAVERARSRRPDLHAAAALADANGWERAFEAELRDLARVG